MSFLLILYQKNWLNIKNEEVSLIRPLWNNLSFLKERTLNINSYIACCDNNFKTYVFIVFKIKILYNFLCWVVTPTKTFHSDLIGLSQSYDFCICEKVNLIKTNKQKHCSTAYENSKFFIPARKTAVVLLSFYLPHTLNYP